MSQKKDESGNTQTSVTAVPVRIVLDESSREFSKRLDNKSVSEATQKDARALEQLADVRIKKSG
jgi:hypothetical protein